MSQPTALIFHVDPDTLPPPPNNNNNKILDQPLGPPPPPPDEEGELWWILGVRTPTSPFAGPPWWKESKTVRLQMLMCDFLVCKMSLNPNFFCKSGSAPVRNFLSFSKKLQKARPTFSDVCVYNTT